MKTNAIIRIIVWSLVIVLILGVLGGVLAFRRYSIHHSETSWVAPIVTPGSGELHGEEHLLNDDESITYLDIEWAAGTILIQPGDTDRIQLAESGRFDTDEAMVYHQNGSKLTIRFQEKDVFIGLEGTVSKDLTITVPRSWVGKSIDIDAASARVELKDLTVGEVEFDGASGDCYFENCHIGNLDIDTASGNVEFSGTLNNLEFDAASAKFSGHFTSCPNSLELNTMSGDAELVLPADCGFRADLDTLSGKFHSDCEVSKTDDTYRWGDGSCRIRFSGMSGNLSVRQGDACAADAHCNSKTGHHGSHHSE